MAAQRFGEFNPEDDATIYLERLEQHFVANNVTDEKIKTGTLLSSIGTDTYKLIRNLCYPEPPKSKSFDQVVELLKLHYCPRANVWRERRQFYEIMQSENETVAEWYAKVRSMAINCDFGAELKSILRDKFISGLLGGPVFDSMCEIEKDASLDNAVKKAMEKENSRSNQNGGRDKNLNYADAANSDSMIENDDNEDDIFSVRRHRKLRNYPREGRHVQQQQFQVGNTGSMTSGRRDQNFDSGQRRERSDMSTKQRKCRCCGDQHFEKYCRFNNAYCRLCGKKGHIRRVCQKNKQINHMENRYENFSNNSSSDEEQQCYNEKNLYSVTENSNSNIPFCVNVKIDGKTFKMDIDSGSAVSCLGSSVYDRHFKQNKLLQDNTILKVYNGNKIIPRGYFVTDVTYNNKTKPTKFYIVDNAGPNLLGRDWIGVMNLKIEINNSIRLDNDIQSIVRRYPTVFSDKIGCFKYAKVSIELISNATPIFF